MLPSLILTGLLALTGGSILPFRIDNQYDWNEPSYVSQECEMPAQPPDPGSNCCGVDNSSTNRIIGGDETTPEQYPWMAILEYYSARKRRYATPCSGFLISGRYALTAAHCLVGEITTIFGKPAYLILGEHDKKNEGPDCMHLADGEICNDGAIRILIESTLAHPKHYHDNVTNVFDIGLIRLTEPAPYTNFIRPICLPTTDFSGIPPADLTLFTAGWGAIAQYKVNELGRRTFLNEYSDVKQHVGVPLKNIKDCQKAWGSFISRNHICGSGDGKGSCKGDSGGPLMYENDGVVQAAGLVSFGAKRCDLDVPSVYTNVYAYRDWILSNIHD